METVSMRESFCSRCGKKLAAGAISRAKKEFCCEVCCGKADAESKKTESVCRFC